MGHMHGCEGLHHAVGGDGAPVHPVLNALQQGIKVNTLSERGADMVDGGGEEMWAATRRGGDAEDGISISEYGNNEEY